MSSPQFTLFVHNGPGPNPYKVAFALEALNLSYKAETLEFGTGPGTVKGDDFLKINPNGRVPAIVDHKNNDFAVWESGAILYYLAEKYDTDGKFFGKTVEEKAEVMTWLAFQLSGPGPAQGQVNWFTHYHDWKGDAPAPSVLDRYKNEVNRCHSVLETRLKAQKAKGSEYIALDRVTIADLAFHGWLRIIQMAKMSLDDYPTLKAYAAKLEALPYVKAGSDKLGEAIANHKSKQ